MPRPSSATVMTALGFSPEEDRLYHRLLDHSGREVAVVAQELRLEVAELDAALEPLTASGIVRVVEGRVHVDPPASALARFVEETARGADQARRRLASVTAALPLLTGSAAGVTAPLPSDPGDTAPLDGELTSGTEPVALITELVRECAGDLSWLRPGGLDEDTEAGLTDVVGEALAAGCRSRALYPYRALAERSEVLRARAALGEEVRLLAELPTSMLVIGRSYVVLPEPLGFAGEPRTLTRQRGLVDALQLWFEELWERATPVPDLDEVRAGGRAGDRLRRPDLRRVLLQELAAGAQDEQIARRLGVSLRTVRRRVAEAMADLGAETRFQAGVEAVRRGWL